MGRWYPGTGRSSTFSGEDDDGDDSPDAVAGTFTMQHTSLEAGDTDSQKKSDVTALFQRARNKGIVVCTGTEAGTDPTSSLLKAAAETYNYWLRIGGDSWVAFDRKWATKKVDDGFTKVLDSGSGHSARGVTWMTCETPLGRISVAALHLLTAKSSEQEPNANPKLQDAAVQWAKDHGPLAFVNADTNMNDAKKNVWGSKDLTTCWDELGKYPDTLEGGPANTIDVCSRLTSGPTKFTAARRFTDGDFKLYADHMLIQATVKLT